MSVNAQDSSDDLHRPNCLFSYLTSQKTNSAWGCAQERAHLSEPSEGAVTARLCKIVPLEKTKAPAKDQVERKKNAVMFPTLQLESKLYTVFLEDGTLMQSQETSMMRRLMG